MPSKSAKPEPRQLRKIVIVAYEGTKLLDVSGPLQAFSDACREDGSRAYEVLLASEAGGPIVTDTGIAVNTMPLDETAINAVDTLLVSGGDPELPPDSTQSLRTCLANYLDRPRRLGSICTGAFILAAMGVFDGHEAATHWACCERLARDYPRVTVKPDAIFVSSGRVWSSAGVSAGIDMALAMIEEDLGHLAALKLARELVLFLKRPGGQAQFSAELQRQTNDARGRFEELHNWIRSNLDADLSVPALAGAARMSQRNFARIYHRETGESPARAVERLRVEAAGRLLESASDPIQLIARRTGFGDDERMRRAFVKTYGVSPQDYRSRFGRLSA